MTIPRNVSGAHLADVLCRRWQYNRVHQAGSHIILETIRLGTLSSILRAVASHKGVPRGEIIADL